MTGNNYIDEKKKAPSVSWMPGWLLAMKGFIDSEFGEQVCNTYLEKLHTKMCVFAEREDRIVEGAMIKLRAEAKELIDEIIENRKALLKIPAIKEGDSIEIARENAGNLENANDMEQKLRDNFRRLTVIPEEMMHIETYRNMYIHHSLRISRDLKMKSYVKGVQTGKCPNFKCPDLVYDDSGRRIYQDEHDALKRKIEELLMDKEGA